jgi:hypothetical protein
MGMHKDMDMVMEKNYVYVHVHICVHIRVNVMFMFILNIAKLSSTDNLHFYYPVDPKDNYLCLNCLIFM